MLSKVTVALCIPTYDVRVFQLLHSIATVWYCQLKTKAFLIGGEWCLPVVLVHG